MDKNNFRPLRVGIILGIGALALTGGGIYYITTRNQLKNISSNAFHAAPAFSLPDVAGRTHGLSDYPGEVLIVHFWASWCPPCLSEIPQWVELADHFKGRPFQMIAVSEDEKWADAQKVLPSQKLASNIASVLDNKGEVADRYGSYQFPETYLLNSRHEIVAKWVGGQDWKDPRLLNFLGEIISHAEAEGKGGGH